MKTELWHFLWGFWCGAAFIFAVFLLVHWWLNDLRKGLEKAFREHWQKMEEDTKKGLIERS